MQNQINSVFARLGKVRGLQNPNILSEEDKRRISEMEDSNNIGVARCIGKKFTVALTHDSKFRQPAGSIVIRTPNGSIFPALPFPELKDVDALSASPSKKVHDYLVARFGMKTAEEHATLLIGFDI